MPHAASKQEFVTALGHRIAEFSLEPSWEGDSTLRLTPTEDSVFAKAVITFEGGFWDAYAQLPVDERVMVRANVVTQFDAYQPRSMAQFAQEFRIANNVITG